METGESTAQIVPPEAQHEIVHDNDEYGDQSNFERDNPNLLLPLSVHAGPPARQGILG